MNRPQLSGVLNINKPPQITSRRVVDAVVKFLRPAKAGHAGTLDPLATGVLVVCVGSATRLIRHVQEGRKEYRADFLLGQHSDTDDVTGDVRQTPDSPHPDRGDIEKALLNFLGDIDQVPPRYSAVHVEGKRAYQLARMGKEIQLQPRTVHVERLDLLDYRFPKLRLKIECGSGTYIRAIGRDLGKLLGCGAVMSRLVRTRVGSFTLDSAIDLQQLKRETLPGLLLPPLSAVEHLSRYRCSSAQLQEISHGRPIDARVESAPTNGRLVVVISPQGELAAVAKFDESQKRLVPRQVFVAD